MKSAWAISTDQSESLELGSRHNGGRDDFNLGSWEEERKLAIIKSAVSMSLYRDQMLYKH